VCYNLARLRTEPSTSPVRRVKCVRKGSFGQSLMRLWICWLVSFLFIFSAVAELLPVPVAAGRVLPASSLTSLASVSVCRCRACASGAACCCSKAHSAVQGLLLRARCDNPPQTTLSLRVALLPVYAVTTPLCSDAQSRIGFVRRAFSARSRTVDPLDSPPRSL
jgi:hypothetical protein